jgi:trimethylamine--corrinoid protein Co-methyltransferase
MRGVTINEKTLARETIHNTKPGSGFLAESHTLDNWKWAQWRPDLIDRLRYDDWASKGCKDMTARANERARRILQEHEVPPLPEVAEKEISAILKARAAQSDK